MKGLNKGSPIIRTTKEANYYHGKKQISWTMILFPISSLSKFFKFLGEILKTNVHYLLFFSSSHSSDTWITQSLHRKKRSWPLRFKEQEKHFKTMTIKDIDYWRRLKVSKRAKFLFQSFDLNFFCVYKHEILTPCNPCQ